ncbi:restriction endonuclease subunit S [Pseudomonas sp. TMP9]|uniref:restriction endonuclease subunit S n=1 Tax=Pseudomonas sp. TMP9 TaxID=3133144 RepID=UPI0030CCFCD5
MSIWHKTKFGEICREVNLSTKNPIIDGYERYIGLEHLDSGSLKINRWGIIAKDNPSFTRVFKKGHILFGKRRSYLKKAALAEFDGICSGDILVLEPKENTVSTDYLSRIIHTDYFWDWAIKTSSGSLSPRTKFSALKDLQLTIANLNRQSAVVNILDRVDQTFSLKEHCLSSAEKMFCTLMFKEIWKTDSSLREYKIEALGEIKLGRQRSPKYTKGLNSKPYLRVVNVLDGELDFDDVEQMDFNEKDYENHKLLPKDILITEGDITSIFNVGRSAMYNGEIDNCCIQNTLIRFRCGPLIIPEFALYLFRCAYYKRIFAYAANVTTVAHLGVGRFGAIKLSIPSIEKQRGIVERLSAANEIVNNLRTGLTSKNSFRRAMSAGLMET